MKCLNNNGFAITGILYTLMVLFLLMLLSVLNGLSTRKTMLENSTEVLEKSFMGNDVGGVSVEDLNSAFTSDGAAVAPYEGKYVFDYSDNVTTLTCSVYLKKGEKIDEESLKGRLVPRDCNDYEYTLGSSDLGIKMTLTNIYSFEEAGEYEES